MVPTRWPFTETTNAIIRSALLWPNDPAQQPAHAGETVAAGQTAYRMAGLLEQLDTSYGLRGDGPEPVAIWYKGSRVCARSQRGRFREKRLSQPRCGIRAARHHGGFR